MTDRPTRPAVDSDTGNPTAVAVRDGREPVAPRHRPLRAQLAAAVAGRTHKVVPVDPTADADSEATEPVGLRIGLPAAVWGLSAITTVLAATGQIGFARWAGVTDWRQFLVPAGLELVAGAFLLLGYRRARRGHAPALMWVFACVIGGFAVYTNVVHAGPRAGLLFGAATVITLLLWFAKLYDDYRDFRELIDEDGLGLLWLTSTRLAFRALLVGRRLRIRKVTQMVTLAEVWIAVYDDARQAEVKGRRLRRRTAWRSVLRTAGHPVASLPAFATVDRVSVVEQPASETATAVRPTPKPSAGPAPAADSRPASGKRSATPRAGGRPTHLRRVFSPAAVANARLLRGRYGDRLPSEYVVRQETGWSYDRANPAVAAFKAGADLDDDPEERAPEPTGALA